MHILVINSGSSSIKFSMFSSENGEPKSLYEGEISGIGTSHPQLTFKDAFGENLSNGQNSSPAATPPRSHCCPRQSRNWPQPPRR